MAITNENASLTQRLERLGDPRPIRWEDGAFDYVDVLDVTAEDVPELLEVLGRHIEPWECDADKDFSWAAAIHAWRALAQLRAPEAVDVLLELMDPMDEANSDWYLEEFPTAFAWIGPPAVEPVAAYLADRRHLDFPRVAAANGLAKIAQRHGELRGRAVDAIAAVLAGFEETDPALNGSLVAVLLDMKATEVAEVIERAFAADRVDLKVVGNWNRVRQTLGVEGLGLVPEQIANQPIPSLLPPGLEQRLRQALDLLAFRSAQPSPGPAFRRGTPNVGRNAPCPCGSGKKYKKCCGR